VWTLVGDEVMARPPKLVKVAPFEPYCLSYEDAARFLGIGTKTLRNRVSEGNFPVKVRRLGSKPVFLVRELRDYAESLPRD
jgi:predicted DNA-binding transcriptional regulator AlpA